MVLCQQLRVQNYCPVNCFIDVGTLVPPIIVIGLGLLISRACMFVIWKKLLTY